ncbi:hypothetical protein [Mycobacteroides abscessus]|uniref:Uncharacterized protein n=1 Tax=Mycobacteroides abscessus TaxID=36809 RepID=A0ABD7HW40_9MYCO|nr:hypothetical protein [Mycobacteroides abscessus]AWG66962.1 hypothetical protein DDT46_09190 [Mycobacteroides abscessus]PVA71377.1 hypothetical protein DDJ37_20440 [Mycobacteroides abscessus]PVB10552.1 hypothetical protein DDJ40_22770 [Mycobacteroides abscessus]PVB22139.1 hypothetical protein DDJ71_12635 [Mycobacteroides abscessus]RIR16227.1 hypothetical protein D2E27_09005 [Mycobacteroides abscessus]
MTAVAAADEALVNRADQLQKLRQQMAAISGKVGGGRSAAGHFPEALPDAQSLLPGSDALARSIGHVLRRGTVAVAGGARSLPLEVVASVTAAGGYAAIVGMPEVSVLAAVERGADLSRLALIPRPGLSAVEVASVLMDGMDLVVLGLGGRQVTSTSARAIVARAHSNGCTLLAVGGDWEGASVRLQAQITGYDGVSACGLGRIRGVRTAVRVRGRGGREVCGSRGAIRSA